ncbi:MAG: UDP-N-acetylmuramate dehydrogenase [Xanthomonadales bacterium]|jgi:UDP-N-acetylmuramate dehydrogenase|nr:UDP-N-acetylmuramate dehydrogenase [Xanthomonadales bacterium]
MTPEALASLTTFGVAATAQRIVALRDAEDLQKITFDPDRDLVLGDGSNVLLAGDVPGTVWLNRLAGRQLSRRDGDRVAVRVGAGEPWHDVVRWTLDQGLSGLENLSLIPGRCGAAPLQNIGAYGVELAESLEAVEAWDWRDRQLVHLAREDCGFAYRDSRFKSGEPNRWLITALHLSLSTSYRPRLEYRGLREALGKEEVTAKNVSDAVIRLRRSKLPDPDRIGNAGSFFKNPVVEDAVAERLRALDPPAPLYGQGDGSWKTSAAWLIEAAGWKGFREGDAGVSEQHALVLVNHGNATGAELLSLARRIQADIRERFGIELEPEPRIIECSP